MQQEKISGFEEKNPLKLYNPLINPTNHVPGF